MARTPEHWSNPRRRPADGSTARVGRAPMDAGRERPEPAPNRRTVGPRSAVITVMVRAAAAASRGLKRDFGELEDLQIKEKAPGDFVTAADVRTQRMLRESLLHARPEYGFLGEEGDGVAGDGVNRWIVDPVDGTTNFMHGLPHFAISIALERDGDVIAGVVYQPLTDEVYWAEKGAGAWLDAPNMRSRRLRVSGRKALADSLLATGIPFRKGGDHDRFMGTLRAAMASTTGVRRWGAASLDLAFVAAGRFDAFWEFDLSPWDVAAGNLLVKEAGGQVTDLSGAPYALGGPSLLASNAGLHGPMVDLMRG
jgi:myo-inositol-1(or 4)-monophosphatase